MATSDMYTIQLYNTVTATTAWAYNGNGSYYEGGHGNVNCIKVDKGSPDKAQFVIFYAELNVVTGSVGEDPMIFCKTQKELDREMAKLMKRSNVAKESIRVFTLAGGVKK